MTAQQTPAADTRSIAALGPDGFVLGFRLAGLEDIIPAQGDEVPQAFETILERKDIAIVVCRAEDVNSLPRKVRDKVEESVDPVFVKLGEGASAGLREKVRNAIGIDLFKE